MEKKHVINCSVCSCEYNKSRKCNADDISICLNNSVIASNISEMILHFI